MKSARDAVAVGIGGAAGAILRVGLDGLIPTADGIPWATLLANVAGAAILGAVAATHSRGGRPGRLGMPLLGIGFCGGLTTFSALSWELFDLLDRGSIGGAAAYAGLSLTLGYAALRVGSSLAQANAERTEAGKA